MVEGYEWVFVICYASMVLGGLALPYLVIGERRARVSSSRTNRSRSPRPKYPARPLRRIPR
jgi:hypothetical protein